MAEGLWTHILDGGTELLIFLVPFQRVGSDSFMGREVSLKDPEQV